MIRSVNCSQTRVQRDWFTSSFIAVLIMVLVTACGDNNDKETVDKGPSAIDQAREAIAENSSKPDTLLKIRERIDQRIAEGEDLDLWQDLRRSANRKIADSFKKLAESAAVENATALIEFGEGLKANKNDKDLAKEIDQSLKLLYTVCIAEDRDNIALREKRGDRKFTTDLNAAITLDYIDEDADIKQIKELQKLIEDSADITSDKSIWLPYDWRHFGKLDAVEKMLVDRKSAYEEQQKDPFNRQAIGLFNQTTKDLAKIIEGTSFSWVGRVHKPYIFIVEKDKAWNETDVAKEKAEMLHQLIELFYAEYGELLGLTPIKEPVPVVVFKRHQTYAKYAAERGADSGAVGHFEHNTGRLFVSDETDRDTLFHEGTHQVIAFNTGSDHMQANFLTRSYWFQEGVAEYFGGTHTWYDHKNKKWRYDLGRLQIGRLSYWRSNEKKAYKLWDLLDLTYATREKNKRSGNEELNLFSYSQGWFLIYFLINFNVDAEGVVQIGKPGKYTQEWRKYFKGELEGKTGRRFFLECMGLMKNGQLDEAAYKKFDQEFTDYYEWISRKTSMKYHVKDRVLIPWDKVTNKGKMIGDKEDDMLKYDNN